MSEDDALAGTGEEAIIIPTVEIIEDTAVEIRPFQFLGGDGGMDQLGITDFRPLPVEEDEVEVVTGPGPKDSSVVESAPSLQELVEETVVESLSQQAPPVPTAPVVKVSGTPAPPVPSTPPS